MAVECRQVGVLSDQLATANSTTIPTQSEYLLISHYFHWNERKSYFLFKIQLNNLKYLMITDNDDEIESDQSQSSDSDDNDYWILYHIGSGFPALIFIIYINSITFRKDVNAPTWRQGRDIRRNKKRAALFHTKKALTDITLTSEDCASQRKQDIKVKIRLIVRAFSYFIHNNI